MNNSKKKLYHDSTGHTETKIYETIFTLAVYKAI